MEIHVLCPDGRIRREIYIPRIGYLYFNNPDNINFCNATYVKMGTYPVGTTFDIKDSNQYIIVDIDDELMTNIIDILNRRPELEDVNELRAYLDKLEEAIEIKQNDI